MGKKYYDGMMIHDILAKHLDDKKYVELLTAFAEVKGLDAVEVVRCKDCIRNPEKGVPRTICPCWMDRYMGPEGYCSKGDRNEE